MVAQDKNKNYNNTTNTILFTLISIVSIFAIVKGNIPVQAKVLFGIFYIVFVCSWYFLNALKSTLLYSGITVIILIISLYQAISLESRFPEISAVFLSNALFIHFGIGAILSMFTIKYFHIINMLLSIVGITILYVFANISNTINNTMIVMYSLAYLLLIFIFNKIYHNKVV